MKIKKYPKNIHKQHIKENIELYLMMLPTLALIFLFCYIPMYGIVIAFQDYVPGHSFLQFNEVKWVGLEHIKTFVQSIFFKRIMVNTIRLSVLNLLFGYSVPIIFALLLNEVKVLPFKKFVQTASYLPYFISSVVVAGLVITFVSKNGLVNNVLGNLGVDSQEYIVSKKAYPFIYTFTNIWKGFGFSSILYFSTISSISPTLYESARIDGANRWCQMRHITLPSLYNIIAITLIFQIGGFLACNTDLALLLYHPATFETADVIGTYIYRVGLEGGKYSYSTAVGLFLSIIGFCLVYITNRASNKLTGFGIW